MLMPGILADAIARHPYPIKCVYAEPRPLAGSCKLTDDEMIFTMPPIKEIDARPILINALRDQEKKIYDAEKRARNAEQALQDYKLAHWQFEQFREYCKRERL